MPPLTTTAAEIDHVVEVLAALHRRRVERGPSGPLGRRQRVSSQDVAVVGVGRARPGARVEAAGQWRAPRSFDARGLTGILAGTPGADGVLRLQRLSGPGLPSRRGRPRPTPHSTGGVPARGRSRLVTGSRPVHDELECALAALEGHARRAVVFPTGFAANLSVLSVFGTDGVRIYSDELNHASIIDGCRLARATATVFPHGDLDALDELVSASPERADHRRRTPCSPWTATRPTSWGWSARGRPPRHPARSG